MMQEMMGLKTLAERFKDPEVKRGCDVTVRSALDPIRLDKIVIR
jgi:hypothetical protein